MGKKTIFCLSLFFAIACGITFANIFSIPNHQRVETSVDVQSYHDSVKNNCELISEEIRNNYQYGYVDSFINNEDALIMPLYSKETFAYKHFNPAFTYSFDSEPTITILNAPSVLGVNQEFTLQVIAQGGSESTKVLYSSSDSSVAAINENGCIKGVKIGTTIINASYGTASQSFSLEIVKDAVPTIRIVNAPSSIGVNQNYYLQVQTTGTGTLNFSSSNVLAATINAEGMINGVNEGTTTITVTFGTAHESFNLTVVAEAAPTIKINNIPTSININQTYKLDVTTTGTGELAFYSLNNKIAKVDQEGAIMGVSPGDTSIMVIYGSARSSINIHVTTIVDPGGFDFITIIILSVSIPVAIIIVGTIIAILVVKKKKIVK